MTARTALLLFALALSAAIAFIMRVYSPQDVFWGDFLGYFNLSLTAANAVSVLGVITLVSAFLWVVTSPAFRSAIPSILIAIDRVFEVLGYGLLSTISTSSEITQIEARGKLSSVRRKLFDERDNETTIALKQLEDRIEKQLAQSQELSLFQDGEVASDAGAVLALGRDRLVRETDRLRARSRANLLYGIAISIIAVVALAYTIFFESFEDSSPRDVSEFLVAFIPRLSISVLIQLLGAFFLRLYVSNENDIKQNKNEITNIELKLAALLAISSDRKAVAAWSNQIAKDERNFILKKDEKVSGEVWRTEAEDLRAVLLNLTEKVDPRGPKR